MNFNYALPIWLFVLWISTLFFGSLAARLVAIVLLQRAGGRRMSLGPMCVSHWSCSTAQRFPQSKGSVSSLRSVGGTHSPSPLPYMPLLWCNVKRVTAEPGLGQIWFPNTSRCLPLHTSVVSHKGSRWRTFTVAVLGESRQGGCYLVGDNSWVLPLIIIWSYLKESIGINHFNNNLIKKK